MVGLMLYPDKGFFGRLSGLENLVYYGMLYGAEPPRGPSACGGVA